MSLTSIVMALIVSAQSHCIELPKNFENYRNFAGIAVSEDFARYVYMDRKGNLIEGKLPKWGLVSDGNTTIKHNLYHKNGNVEDHQVCIKTERAENYWCGEPIHDVYPVKGAVISYLSRIIKTPVKIIAANTRIEDKCELKEYQ